ncbi:MAG: M28 family peptidase, partial [Chitinophagales bacterium]
MQIFKTALLVLLCHFGLAQNIDYARNQIDTLCSPVMHGRGYVQDGMKIAADYIAVEFERLGLEKAAGNYLQEYTVPVNTFPGKMEVKLGKKELNPGEDFIVKPGSPSIEGSFKINYIDRDLFLDKEAFYKQISASKNKFIGVLPSKKEYGKEEKQEIEEGLDVLTYAADNPALGTLIFDDSKLTWHLSQKQFARPTLILQSGEDKPAKKVQLNIETKLMENYPVQNVIGYLQGTSDSVILISAHYDHLGRMGAETYFPGANDNASGTALMLDLARHYAQLDTLPPYSFLFIAFGAEELGLLGSEYYTKNPLMPLGKIKFQINLDICGTGDKGIQVVNGSVHQKRFDLLQEINKREAHMHQVKIRGESCNSDHCWFHKNGVPAFFIYTLGGAGHYHDVHDIPENLTLGGYEG